MTSRLDERVVPPWVRDFILACQRAEPVVLAGGGALSGAHLRHRLSRDVDLFAVSADVVRSLAQRAPELARSVGASWRPLQSGSGFVRGELTRAGTSMLVDLVTETIPPLGAPVRLDDGVVVASHADLRAAKLTCILSRSEPRDLVDLKFLDDAGYPPERDLAAAATKDAGTDPAMLFALLENFPTAPLPDMLSPLTPEDLRRFRDDLRERFRRASLPGG